MSLGLKVIITDGFTKEVLNIHYFASNLIQQAHFLVTLKSGLIGERLKLTKDEIKEVEILHEKETSSDNVQRIKHGAIGFVLLGPVGLLGAALGGAKSVLQVRVLTQNNYQFVIEVKPKECEKIFKELMGINLQEEVNKGLLKNGDKPIV